MIDRLKSSATLLLFLGVLFSIPIVAKTWSAHGALPALATSLLVIASVFIGPLSFVVAKTVDSSFIGATSFTSLAEIMLILFLGVAVLLAWVRSLSRREGSFASYLLVTGWALIGAYFCVSIVFTHAT